MSDIPFAGSAAPAFVSAADAAGLAAAPADAELRPAGAPADAGAARYFPAIICAEFDSPIDALLALTVPRDEALDLVVAAWPEWRRELAAPVSPAPPDELANKVYVAAAAQDLPALLTRISGGRHVAVMLTAAGRWAACNAFPEPPCLSLADAEARLAQLLRRRRRGCIGRLA
ncbi:hypothetical protein [Rhodocyclus tenuis]|uniref:Uncharacterized protein n=1 Tax=Rhodocyclus tenuis TaxID=1066 RepID=A0A840G146_RHOTE|nr:hypothetical protein [Rhodocyclus tenuis]MBB4246183.1 hypothetical protein [Rhodocyclus tenuis]